MEKKYADFPTRKKEKEAIKLPNPPKKAAPSKVG